MKKIIALLLAAVITLAFAGCGIGAKYISKSEATDIALDMIDGVTEENVTKCEFTDWDNNLKIYDVEVTADDIVYEVKIDAAEGVAFKFESEFVKSDNAEYALYLKKEEVKKIALEKLEDAKESDILVCMLDTNDEGDTIYYLEVYQSSFIYLFEIDAQTGEILSIEKVTQ